MLNIIKKFETLLLLGNVKFFLHGFMPKLRLVFLVHESNIHLIEFLYARTEALKVFHYFCVVIETHHFIQPHFLQHKIIRKASLNFPFHCNLLGKIIVKS